MNDLSRDSTEVPQCLSQHQAHIANLSQQIVDMESMQERLRWSKELQLAGMNLDSAALSLQLKGELAGPP